MGEERSTVNPHKDCQRRRRAITAGPLSRPASGGEIFFGRIVKPGVVSTLHNRMNGEAPQAGDYAEGAKQPAGSFFLDSFFASSDKERGTAWLRSFFVPPVSPFGRIVARLAPLGYHFHVLALLTLKTTHGLGIR